MAAILGRLDGVNLFDPFWIDPEYKVWYGLLDCGIQLQVSTGADWFVSSSNRGCPLVDATGRGVRRRRRGPCA